MNRRVFLRETVLAAGVAACGVGGLWVRCARGRSRIVEQLMDAARPVLDRHALQEQELPGPAAEKIRVYFDRACLNVEGFLSEINTPAFRQMLGKARTPERRHHELLTVFYRRVEGAAGIGEEVRKHAEEIGHELDRHWSNCRKEIGTAWQASLKEAKGPSFDAEKFNEQVTTMVRTQMEQAVLRARGVVKESKWREVVRSLGTEALMASQQTTFDVGGRTIEVPEFILNASRQVFRNILDLLGDAQWDCQSAMTKRVAALGNKVGAEFEKEMRRRLNDLHRWREQAVLQVAEEQAAQRVGFFGEHG